MCGSLTIDHTPLCHMWFSYHWSHSVTSVSRVVLSLLITHRYVMEGSLTIDRTSVMSCVVLLPLITHYCVTCGSLTIDRTVWPVYHVWFSHHWSHTVTSWKVLLPLIAPPLCHVWFSYHWSHTIVSHGSLTIDHTVWLVYHMWFSYHWSHLRYVMCGPLITHHCVTWFSYHWSHSVTSVSHVVLLPLIAPPLCHMWFSYHWSHNVTSVSCVVLTHHWHCVTHWSQTIGSCGSLPLITHHCVTCGSLTIVTRSRTINCTLFSNVSLFTSKEDSCCLIH